MPVSEININDGQQTIKMSQNHIPDAMVNMYYNLKCVESVYHSLSPFIYAKDRQFDERSGEKRRIKLSS